MQNIDLNEINKFSELAAAWWDPAGQCKPLHDINPLRLSFITQHCSLTGKKILDIGCGGGILTESLAQYSAQVTGIDMSEAALNAARQHAAANQLGIDYQLTTAEAHATAHPQQYDVVTCMELLEHVPDPVSVIQACRQLVKPGGPVFLSTLNRTPKAFLWAIVGAEYLLKMLPAGTHEYAKFIKPAELAAWLRQHQLTLTALQGLSYNPLTKCYALSEDVSVNYLVYAQSS